MVMATLTSVASLTHALSLDSSRRNLRDVSFSSFLNYSEEIVVRKLAESNQNVSSQEDEEIGVFGAEKYFNGGTDEDSPRISRTVIPRKYHLPPKKDAQLNDHMVPIKPSVHPATPSVHSESSWNSQSALLRSVHRRNLQTKTNKVRGKIGKNIFAALGCKCSCSNKDSIDVDDEHVGEISFKKSTNAAMLQGKAITEEECIKASLDLDRKPRSRSQLEGLEKLGTGMNKENSFRYPTSNSEAGKLPKKLQLRQESIKPGKSLEVFGSPVHDRRSQSFRIERRLPMLSSDAAAPRMEEIDYSATSGGVYNDNDSDASSDLFEIESLTGKVIPFLTRQGSDDVTSGCLTPTTCYAPSEASIEWSVVTASAADFSVMSNHEELKPPTTASSSPIKAFLNSANAKSGIGKDSPRRRRSSILLGCNGHKAVSVAGDAYKTNDNASFESRTRRTSDFYEPVTRFQAETKPMGFHPRQRQHVLSTHLQSFHSSYTQ